jgi:peptidoglycan/LPS O-acetylase OafA/YrhL
VDRHYAIFFGFGAWYFDAEDREGMVGRGWWISLPIALLILFPIGHTMGPQHAELGRLMSVLIQVADAWLLTFGMMGLFRRFCSRESKAWRYISDSSYWLYLAHVPLIMLAQHCVRGWAISPWIKFPLVCAVTSGLLLLSYPLFVRYTWIGTLLNGPRRRVPRIEEPIDALVLDGGSAG